MKKISLPIFVPIALAAVLITLAGCTVPQRMRMYHKPVRVDQFYTTSYSGDLTKWPTMALRNTPPRVDRFRRGERICVAIHSFPGEGYYWQSMGGEKKLEFVWGYGYPMVLGTPVRFESLAVGGDIAGWRATCLRERPSRRPEDDDYEKTPSRWNWVESLPPGAYTLRIKIKEDRTERTFSLDTSFTVE